MNRTNASGRRSKGESLPAALCFLLRDHFTVFTRSNHDSPLSPASPSSIQNCQDYLTLLTFFKISDEILLASRLTLIVGSACFAPFPGGRVAARHPVTIEGALRHMLVRKKINRQHADFIFKAEHTLQDAYYILIQVSIDQDLFKDYASDIQAMITRVSRKRNLDKDDLELLVRMATPGSATFRHLLDRMYKIDSAIPLNLARFLNQIGSTELGTEILRYAEERSAST